MITSLIDEASKDLDDQLDLVQQPLGFTENSGDRNRVCYDFLFLFSWLLRFKHRLPTGGKN